MNSPELIKAILTDCAYAWLRNPVDHLAPGNGTNRFKVSVQAVQDIKLGCQHVLMAVQAAADGDAIADAQAKAVAKELEAAKADYASAAKELMDVRSNWQATSDGLAAANLEIDVLKASLVAVTEGLKATAAKHDLHHEPAVGGTVGTVALMATAMLPADRSAVFAVDPDSVATGPVRVD